jgi:ribonuclease P protein component
VAIPRLKRRSEFLRVAEKRCKWAAPGLILQAAPAASLPSPTSPLPAPDASATKERVTIPGIRVGFTCSKKVGNAVARNRAKRRLRAIAEQILPLQGTPGTDYVLIGRQETVTRSFALLLQDLQTALKRVGSPRKGGSGDKSRDRQNDQEAP